MNDQLQEKLITVSSVEQQQWGLKIKDAQNLVYNISQTKKDGTPTVAYQAISALPNNGMNTELIVKFAEVPNQRGGTSRYVRMIDTNVSNALKSQNASNHANAQKNAGGDNFKRKNAMSEEDWKKVSWGKCKYGFLIEIFKKGPEKFKNDIGDKKFSEYAEYLAERWADLAMRNTKENIGSVANPQELPAADDAPPIIDSDDIQVQDIPF